MNTNYTFICNQATENELSEIEVKENTYTKTLSMLQMK